MVRKSGKHAHGTILDECTAVFKIENLSIRLSDFLNQFFF